LTEALALLMVDTHDKEKPTTLNDLAAMINHGFTEAQKQTDAQVAALNGELTGIMKDMAEELTATHEDVRYVRNTVTKLVRNDVAQDAAINTLSARVARLEKKVGLTN
jgi:anaerobic ribonucleoside-triphosphate reductase